MTATRPPCVACGAWKCHACGTRRMYANRFYPGEHQCESCLSYDGEMQPVTHRHAGRTQDHADEAPTDREPRYPL